MHWPLLLDNMLLEGKIHYILIIVSPVSGHTVLGI